ncbi:MAG: hypothetical protein GW865_02620 [Candidatus Aenigmarchaeota archaeon]|nr:hypothetical protein [Candidatus Aenigmarchaeota archaeon]
MENKDVWKSIFEEDPLFKPQREKLSKIIDVQKVSNFIINSQTNSGKWKPNRSSKN